MSHEAWGWFSLFITVLGCVPYFVFILKGKTKPHAFSWAVWGLLTVIAFCAQLSERAGPGAWAMGLTVVFCFLFAGMALFWGEKNVTRSDWISFAFALTAIPVWIVTQDALWAVVLVTVIDAVGFYPTWRKSWHRPHEEMAFQFLTGTVKWIPVLFALENFNWTTALYPASLVVMNGSFVAMLMWRRAALAKQAA